VLKRDIEENLWKRTTFILKRIGELIEKGESGPSRNAQKTNRWRKIRLKRNVLYEVAAKL